MTAPNRLTADELREWAPLDVYGLLEHDEAELFERSFRDAPASVQDQIRALQAELAETDTLPDVLPPSDLRARTIERVVQLADDEAERLAPIGMVGGPSREASGRRVSGLSWFMWRAATFVLAATGVMLLVFLSVVNEKHNQLTEWALTGFTSDQIQQQIGPDFTEFLFDSEVKRFVFSNAGDPEGSEQAVLYVNEQTGEAFLICDNLPADQEGKATYTLSLIVDDDEPRQLRRFDTRGAMTAVRLEVPVNQLAAAQWEITGPEDVRLVT